MASYLVTGSAGFIGARVSELLLENGHRVVGIDDMSDGYDSNLKEWRLARLRADGQFTFFKTDIRARNALSEVFVFRSYDAVINLGARAGVRQSLQNPWIYAETNYLGTLNLLDLCRAYGVGKFVLASTSTVYGADTLPPFKESAQSSMPFSPYAASKKAAEALCYSYYYVYGLDTTVFRFFTVYGPAGRPDMSIFRFIRAVTEDQPLTLYGDGGERDYTHVDDVAKGVVAGITPLGYEIINLGGDRPVKISYVISLVEDLLGKKATVEVAVRPTVDMDSTWADISKARQLLGWRPQVDIERGIEEAVCWYLDNREWAKHIDG